MKSFRKTSAKMIVLRINIKQGGDCVATAAVKTGVPFPLEIHFNLQPILGIEQLSPAVGLHEKIKNGFSVINFEKWGFIDSGRKTKTGNPILSERMEKHETTYGDSLLASHDFSG